MWCDEFGVNLWTTRTQGRSEKGERAIHIVHKQRGQNVTILLFVSAQYGLVHYGIVNGGMTQDCFKDSLSELHEVMTGEEFVLLMDNATPHQNNGYNGFETHYLPK